MQLKKVASLLKKRVKIERKMHLVVDGKARLFRD